MISGHERTKLGPGLRRGDESHRTGLRLGEPLPARPPLSNVQRRA